MTTTTSPTLCGLLLKGVFSAFLFLSLSACTRNADPVSVPLSDASHGLEGVVAHVTAADALTTQAVPTAPPAAKLLLATAHLEHTAALDDARRVDSALGALSNAAIELREQVADLKQAVAAQDAKWYTRWGKAIEALLWIAGIALALFSLLSIIHPSSGLFSLLFAGVKTLWSLLFKTKPAS
jgi:hypothetical protein